MAWFDPERSPATEPILLSPGDKIAIYMEGAIGDPSGKMGYGVLRYSRHHLACVVNSSHAGEVMEAHLSPTKSVPVVASLADALALGANVFLLGVAPWGGAIPSDWWPVISEAVAAGMSVVNGLHEQLSPHFPALKPNQWIWDIRREPEGLIPGRARAREHVGKRVLFIGTDMSVGKMTAGLEIYAEAVRRGVKTAFVATGQIGITVTGAGTPLDAVRVDFASGAVEAEVLKVKDQDLILVEGQGSLIHPGSTANLPLLRGSQPTHLVVCVQAGQTHLKRVPEIALPPLPEFIRLYEDLASACGVFDRPVTCCIAVNTAGLTEDEARAECDRITAETGLPTADPVRHGAGALLDAVL